MKLSIPNFIRRDFLRKAVAIFFAVLIWLAIDVQLHETSLLQNVPVTINYDPSEVVLEDTVYTVDVLVKGSRRRLETVTSGDIRIEASIPSHVPVGIYFYYLGISPRNVSHTPPGIRVSSISPSNLDIQLDRIVTKGNVPVRVRYDGELRQGYKLIRHSVIPMTVDIRGPNKIVKDVTELMTEPIFLDETVVQDFEVDVRLAPLGKVQMPEKVHVAVTIAKQSSQQAYHGRDMMVLGSPSGRLRVANELPEVSVTLYGSRKALEALDEHAVRPFVDVSSITSPGTYRQPVNIWINGATGLTAEFIQPKTADVVLVPMEPSETPSQPAGGSGNPVPPPTPPVATP